MNMPVTRVVKRSGEVVDFDVDRIRNAVLKAVHATGRQLEVDDLEKLVDAIRGDIASRFGEFYPNVENIQDVVEKHLVLAGHYEIAKSYILYRADRRKVRVEAQERAIEDARLGKLTVTKPDGRVVLLSAKLISDTIERAAADDLGDAIDLNLLVGEVIRNVYDGVSVAHLERALVLAATAFIELDPAYSRLAARLLLRKLHGEVLGEWIEDEAARHERYRAALEGVVRRGVDSGLLDPRMAEFDLRPLAERLDPKRDLLFHYLGAQTLYDRYFLRIDQQPIELPQTFWMRVAMGLALEEDDREARALEFYDLVSQLRFIPSTPTLFHAGTRRPQLSSCYLTTIDDDLTHIFKSLGDNAQLSKWSGGIGNDWSNIRGTGSPIQSTHVDSQGVIPFLKIANDVTMAINRSCKRRGATCAYLETWHYDVEDFLDLRRNTGDERRRTHDMNTANWIPDLFMKRVLADDEWTLFSPDETPDLHDLYGRAFEERYEHYERLADAGEIRLFKRLPAVQLWRKMLTMLFETGHPWITFKDACNVRSPQDHVGVVHSSNLCTEITLNTSRDETAVCNLGSVNLARHMTEGALDRQRLAETVGTAIRMLDNVIDLNFYPTEEARNSNLRHRPIGLGLMGLQDALFMQDLAFESPATMEFVDETMEWLSYHAILASSRLAAERGPYPSHPGSKWDRGLLPFDTLDLLEQERGVPVEVPRTSRLDWTPVREHLRTHGMRNSNTMAIAPTATIGNIAGALPCIEPIYKNLYVKANISGEFTVTNAYLIEDLKRLGFWGPELLEQLKAYDGRLDRIEEIPDALRAKYREAFDIDPIWCLKLTAVRAKWIDQSQSHNVFLEGTSGKKLHEVYTAAWRMGLKTTYYLRSLAVSQIEKSTVQSSKYGFTQKRQPAAAPAAAVAVETDPQLCRIDDPDCEACQ
jgi:ribonucleoside-diphosphate reductase alpha chain